MIYVHQGVDGTEYIAFLFREYFDGALVCGQNQFFLRGGGQMPETLDGEACAVVPLQLG